jgi:nucleoside-diphosphate-sugar epimerase
VRRVLVTGASGFVGRHVLSPLRERGFEVHAVARRAPATAASIWHEADLLDSVQVDRLVQEVEPTHLLHLAWTTAHGRFWDAHDNLDWIAATLRLVREFREAGGVRAVVAGSCAEYDWSGDCCGAGTALAPATLYGSAKHATRTVLERYAETSGLALAWGRIFFLFGPGEQPTRVVPAAAATLAAGEPFPSTEGRQVRDFLYVADVASAFAALVDSDVQGAFDVGTGEGLTLRDLLLVLERLSGREGLVRFGAVPSRPEPARIVADSRRLRDELGWRPAVTLEQGLALTLAAHAAGEDGTDATGPTLAA